MTDPDQPRVVYPRSLLDRTEPDVDPNLGAWGRRRARRRARKTAGRDRREAYGEQVAAWRRLRAQDVNGLGVVLAVVGVLFAGYVLFVRGDSDPSPAPTAATSAFAPAPAPSTAPSTPTPAQAELTGSDSGDGIVLDGPGGDVAGALLAGYNTYSPTLSDPVGTWVESWSAYATPDVVDAARDGANRLWDFTVRDQVTVTGPTVAGQPVILAGDQGQTSYEVTVQRLLHPVGAGEATPSTPELIRWRVIVAGTDTDTPQVVLVQQLDAGTTPEDDSGAGQ